jgi:6-phosphogluconolactonase
MDSFSTIAKPPPPRLRGFSASSGRIPRRNKPALTTFEFNAATAALKEVDMVSTLPADFKGQSTCAEIEMDPRGRFVYASNRGHDSIAVFAVDAKTGKLTLIQNQSSGGTIPRGFMLDPSESWLVAGNQNRNSFGVFRVDRQTGKLAATGDQFGLGAPVTFVFLK